MRIMLYMMFRFGQVLSVFIWITAILLRMTSPVEARDDPAAFGEQVRQYLLSNPEVILEVLELLSAREAKEQLHQKIAAYPALFSGPAILGLGSQTASIKVVEFFDYKCAPCKAMHPDLENVVAANSDIRIEMRQLPILSPASERASRFALAALEVGGPSVYARIHAKLWAFKGPYNIAVFQKLAEVEQLDWPNIHAAMQSEAVSRRIDENRDIAIALGIVGTPAFVTPTSISIGQSDVAKLAKDWLSQ